MKLSWVGVWYCLASVVVGAESLLALGSSQNFFPFLFDPTFSKSTGTGASLSGPRNIRQEVSMATQKHPILPTSSGWISKASFQGFKEVSEKPPNKTSPRSNLPPPSDRLGEEQYWQENLLWDPPRNYERKERRVALTTNWIREEFIQWGISSVKLERVAEWGISKSLVSQCWLSTLLQLGMASPSLLVCKWPWGAFLSWSTLIHLWPKKRQSLGIGKWLKELEWIRRPWVWPSTSCSPRACLGVLPSFCKEKDDGNGCGWGRGWM